SFGAVGGVPERVGIGQEQIEARIAGSSWAESIQKLRRGRSAAEVIRNQATSRRSLRSRRLEVSEVRNDAETAALIQGQPGAIRPEIPPSQEPVRRGPLGQRCRGPLMKLVSVRRHDEAVTGMRVPGD